MSRFLKLTQIIINTQQINHIKILPNKYEILMMNNGADGFLIGGSGVYKASMDKIYVCAEKDTNDYKKVSDWIHSL
jgi:hypothetical protein